MFDVFNVFGRRKQSGQQETAQSTSNQVDGFELLGETAMDRTAVSPHNYNAINDPTPPYPGAGMYAANYPVVKPSPVSSPIENVPLVLHPALKAATQIRTFWPEMAQQIASLENHKKLLDCFYDFELERSVVNEQLA